MCDVMRGRTVQQHRATTPSDNTVQQHRAMAFDILQLNGADTVFHVEVISRGDSRSDPVGVFSRCQRSENHETLNNPSTGKYTS